jgi:predicted transcriptional regulator
MKPTDITLDNAPDLLPTITDPVSRAIACDDLLAHTIPQLQAAVATIRRAAVYDATLRPGATADTVAAELGVTVKAVSKAIAEQRAADRDLMRAALTAAGVAGDVSARDLDQAATTRDVPLMARRVLAILDRTDTARLGAIGAADVTRARERAHKILDGHN